MLKNIMTVQKSKEEFSVTNNSWLKDTRLGWKSKGLLAYFLSLPDDKNICVKEIGHSLNRWN